MNYQGTGAAQWIVGFPLLLIPILIWYLAYYFFSYETGVAVLAILGLVGILLRNYLMQKIALQYAKRKYDILSGYKQQES
jgi:hypothetical protein